ncbi:MAG: hypothetical protein JNK67_18535 [Alphaproteobacteria bacterium]|nr:hypothetical protein [Alphaproteobacteria bacterium]
MTGPRPEAVAITAERLREILDAYGAEPHRWPADERDAALALIAAQPSLAAEVAAARDLDAMLALHPEPQIPPLNPLAIAAAARRGDGAGGRAVRSWLPQVASLAAAAVLGFAVGISGLGRDPRLPGEDGDPLALIITVDEDML